MRGDEIIDHVVEEYIVKKSTVEPIAELIHVTLYIYMHLASPWNVSLNKS